MMIEELRCQAPADNTLLRQSSLPWSQTDVTAAGESCRSKTSSSGFKDSWKIPASGQGCLREETDLSIYFLYLPLSFEGCSVSLPWLFLMLTLKNIQSAPVPLGLAQVVNTWHIPQIFVDRYVKGSCCQAWWSEFHPRDPHNERKELTCNLSSDFHGLQLFSK